MLTKAIPFIVYYNDSPDAGDPACICSHSECKKPIKAGTMPVRLFREEGDRVTEARFHPKCIKDLIRRGG